MPAASSVRGHAVLGHAFEHLQQGLLVETVQSLRRGAAEEDGRGLDGLFVLFARVDHAGDLLGQPFLQYAQVGSRVVLGDECVDGLTVERVKGS